MPHPDLDEHIKGVIYDWKFDSVGHDHGEKVVVEYSYDYEGSHREALKRVTTYLTHRASRCYRYVRDRAAALFCFRSRRIYSLSIIWATFVITGSSLSASTDVPSNRIGAVFHIPCWVGDSDLNHFGAEFRKSVWVSGENVTVDNPTPEKEAGSSLSGSPKLSYGNKGVDSGYFFWTQRYSDTIRCEVTKIETLRQVRRPWLETDMRNTIFGGRIPAVVPVQRNLLHYDFRIKARDWRICNCYAFTNADEIEKSSLCGSAGFVRAVRYLIQFIGKESQYGSENGRPHHGLVVEEGIPYPLSHIVHLLLFPFSILCFISFVGAIRYWMEFGKWKLLLLSLALAALWYCTVHWTSS